MAKKQAKSKEKTYTLEIEFDSKDSAHAFFAHWLDGGGDGGGNIDWHTDKWKDYNYMRVKGTGYAIDSDGTVLTPEVEEQRGKERLEALRRK
jgi:hypothetical protein